MKDLFSAFVLFIFMLVLCDFLCCHRFSVNKDLCILPNESIRDSNKTSHMHLFYRFYTYAS